MRVDRVKIKSELARRDIKQLDLAHMANISISTVNGICGGRSCSSETAHQVAAALKLPIDEILETEQ